MDLGLQEKAVFISGSSQGIGLAIAKGFLAEGAKVAISGRDSDKLKAVASDLEAQYGPDKVIPITGDMTDEKTIHQALTQVVATFGGLDAVVANLGSGRGKAGWQLGRADWQSMMDVNFFGSMSLANSAIPFLKDSDNATITFISSIAGSEVIPAPISYSAAKAALQHAAKNLSRQLGGDGIRVNTVAPGNILAPGGPWERMLRDDRAAVEDYIAQEVPLARIGSAEELADTVVFLASQRATFVTGALWVVDGGQSHS